MDMENAYRSLQRVAAQEGITVQQVIQNIDETIKIGMESTDPLVKARWAMIPRVGMIPTAVELIAFLGELLTAELYDS